MKTPEKTHLDGMSPQIKNSFSLIILYPIHTQYMIYSLNVINLLTNSRNMPILAKLLVKIIDLRGRPRLPIIQRRR